MGTCGQRLISAERFAVTEMLLHISLGVSNVRGHSPVTREFQMLPAVWVARRLPSAGCVMHLVVCDISFPATMSPSLLCFFELQVPPGFTRLRTQTRTTNYSCECWLCTVVTCRYCALCEVRLRFRKCSRNSYKLIYLGQHNWRRNNKCRS